MKASDAVKKIAVDSSGGVGGERRCESRGGGLLRWRSGGWRDAAERAWRMVEG